MDSKRSDIPGSLTALAFDTLSNAYDGSFTYSDAGKVYRRMVHGYLDRMVLTGKGMAILDINCGTGEDALFLGAAGHQVTALDSSPGMIDIARQKCAHMKNVTILLADMRHLETLNSQSVDVVLSDFGGLNCLNGEELNTLFREVHRLLRPGGHFIAVVMPVFALWEFFHFALRGRFRMAFRRVTGHARVMTGGIDLDVWYYSPRALKGMAGHQFTPVRFAPVGVFMSPGFEEKAHGIRREVFRLLLRFDQMLWKRSLAAGWGDHFLADFIVNTEREAVHG
jgi:ubiquinone/menaquinone biosynthesis C-methylase UbiE